LFEPVGVVLKETQLATKAGKKKKENSQHFKKMEKEETQSSSL